MSSLRKKLIRGGAKVVLGTVFPPLAPGLFASELMNYATEATLGDEEDSLTGKVMKATGKLMGGDADFSDD